MLRLGVAEKRVSDSDDARDVFMDAAGLARQLGDAERLAQAALGYARSWPTVGAVDEVAVELLREAEGMLGEQPMATRALVRSRLACQLLYAGKPDEVGALSREAVQLARNSGDLATLARVLQTHHVTIWQPENIRERLALSEEMFDISGRLGIEEIALWTYRLHIADLMAIGDMEAVDRQLAAYTELAESYRQPIYIWQAAVRRCMLATFRGRLQEAERFASEAFATGQKAGGQNLTAAFGEQMLIVRWLQGRLREIEPLAAASHRAHPSMAIWRAVLAFIYSETGREAKARGELDWISGDGFTRLAHDDTRLIAAVLLSSVAARLGDAGAADELYEELLPYEGRNMILSEGVTCVGASDEYLGMLAATCRRWEMAERHFRAALEMNEQTGGRPWLAHTQTNYGLMLMSRRGPGDRKRASELFQAGLVTARELGMTALQDRLERLLASHKGLAHQLPDGLTQREVEVLRLVAAGKSNKEVSEELVLSLRTTARHVTNIYAKIGARNRADATSYAIRNHLIDG
jgi:DNA-binding CsgD family transcriptional regulator